MAGTKRPQSVKDILAAGYKLWYDEKTKDKLDTNVEQYIDVESNHLVTLEPITIDDVRDWFIFSECITPFIDDEIGMKHRERVGLSLKELELFMTRAKELKEAAENNA